MTPQSRNCSMRLTQAVSRVPDFRLTVSGSCRNRARSLKRRSYMRLQQMPDDQSVDGEANPKKNDREHMEMHQRQKQPESTKEDSNTRKNQGDDARPVLELPHSPAEEGHNSSKNEKKDGYNRTQASQKANKTCS